MIILFDSGLNTFAEWLQAASAVATIVGVIVIVYTVRGYSLSQNQFKFGVMTHCLDRYYAVMFEQSGLKNTDSDMWFQQYCELINEQMFYFQVKYLPLDVIIEWLDGILDFVIIRKAGSNEVINSEVVKDSDRIVVKQEFFPRLKAAFTIHSGNDYKPAFDKENPNYSETRRLLITEVLTNLRGNISPKERKAIMNTKLIFKK
jgi:hypothetical protein